MADNVHITFTSEHEKVLQGLAKVNAKLEKQVGQLRKVNREGKKASKSFDGMTSSLTNMATPAAIIASIGKALTTVQAQARGSAEEIRNMEEALKNLIQQAGGDPAELQRLIELTKRISVSVGVTQERAARGVQKGIALGLSAEDVAGIFQAKLFEATPEELILGAGRQRQIFGQQIADLSSRAIINAFLRAQEKTEVGAAVISALSLGPAGLGKELGGTFAEALGFTGFATTGAETPAIGATQGVGFLAKLGADPERRFDELGILGAAEKFLSLSLEAQRVVVGQRKEARLFASKLREPGGIEQLRAEIVGVRQAIALTGTPQGLFTRELAAAAEDPRIAAINFRQRTKARLALALEPEGVREDTASAVIEVIKTRRQAARRNIFDDLSNAGNAFILSVFDLLGAPPQALSRLGNVELPIGPAQALSTIRGVIGGEGAASIQAEVPEILRSIDGRLQEQNERILRETRAFTPEQEPLEGG